VEYIVHDSYVVLIEKANGQYYRNWKNVYSVLQPQPTADEVHVLKRYYATLKRCPQYRKWVSWLDKASLEHRDKLGCALVEYVGEFPTVVATHGNCKKSVGQFIRTQPDVMAKMREKVRTQQPKNVYTDTVYLTNVMLVSV